jgi:hypothetical protein
MMAKENLSTLGYYPAPAGPFLRLRQCVHITTIIHAGLVLVFCITRSIQLNRPDPYHNPWTDISTAALFGSLLLWAFIAIAAIVLAVNSQPPLHKGVYIWLVFATLLVLAFLLGMCLFIFA